MNRKTLLPLAAAVMAALPLPASALDLPRNGVVLQLADDDDQIHGYWRWSDGRWVPFWAARGDHPWDDDHDDRWDDDRGDDRWGDDEGGRRDNDDDDDDDNDDDDDDDND